MRGVLLAGGLGTRLRPLTDATNKHLLPVGRWPMIYYPMWQLKQFGCKDIMVITGPEHGGDIFRTLGSGKNFGVRLCYRIQDKPLGIANALMLAEPFAKAQDLMVMLGDNIFVETLSNYYHRIESHKACVFIKKVKNPERYGVVEFKDGSIANIVEKPKKPKSNWVQTGCYFYPVSCIIDLFRALLLIGISRRGQYEITDINNYYIEKDRLSFIKIKGGWVDAGTHESYSEANRLAKKIHLGV